MQTTGLRVRGAHLGQILRLGEQAVDLRVLPVRQTIILVSTLRGITRGVVLVEADLPRGAAR